MNNISKDKLLNFVEAHFKNDLTQENYNVQTIKADKLLTSTRFDLAFKLLYLEMLNKEIDFAKEIYKEHIRAFSLGKFCEPGNKTKNSIDEFIGEFKKIFEDIKVNGFDGKKTLIPLSKDGSIANGAHRVASAIYLNKSVDCVKINTNNHIYDYKFFYKRNISNNILDIVATKFVKYCSNIYIAFLWPIGIEKDNKIENIIPNIVYKKNIQLTANGAHNLLSQIYYNEEWLGTVKNNFAGSQGKLIECFKTFDEFEVVAFQAENLEEVLRIKENVRNVFNVGKHSIHVTDTKEEALRVARVVFNNNSLHFLNYAKPNKYISTHQKINTFKKFIEKNSISLDDVVLDSSIILSVYGIREANDIDYFTADNLKLQYHDEELQYHDEELQYHDEELQYHDEDKIEMIYNPKYHFYFNDVKFISFNQLYKMKSNRAEQKDRNDCKMMEALIEENKIKELISKLKQNILYGKIRLRVKLIKVLKVIGLYKILKGLVRGTA